MALLIGDVKNALNAALCGIVVFSFVDFAATLHGAAGSVAPSTAIRLLAVQLGLAPVLYLAVAALMVLSTVLARFLWALLWRDHPFSGLFGGIGSSRDFRSSAPWIWSIPIALSAYIMASTFVSLRLGALFKEPRLTALLAASLQVLLWILLGLAALGLARLFGHLGRALHGRLGRLNPWGRPEAAAVAVTALAIPMVRTLLRHMPQLEPLVPWRHLIGLGGVALGAYLHRQILTRRQGIWPLGKRKRRIALGAFAASALVLMTLVLFSIGGHPDTKALVVSSSPTLSSAMDLVRSANDFDGDGFGSLLGENDCDAFNPKIHPLARDVPDNGIDENCDGGDFKLGELPTYMSGARMPVPAAYQQDWNILLITIDTVRYDHTGFGGYERNTTPELDRFVERSVSFSFANAPSAGTMASVPAILTSKFFHSGIALNENVKRGMPPKLKKENTLISEVLKGAGYRTGAILTHEYFNEWGMRQGFDHYDNGLGRRHNPRGITSHKLTDRAIAWIGKQRRAKWFLWLHYLDPHGRYVSHPGGPDFGQSEKDLYDGELHYTDKHLGRLLDYIARSPMGKKTVIAITSDHGDAFNEHGFINHGQDLYRELLHVPLIVHVPNIKPRVAGGAVSPIDLFPTLADLAGADIGHLALEGESLVPQLFYGKDLHQRVVFAETNWPKPLRAAVNTRYKLIHNIKANVSRLFDLRRDPWEKKNIWTADRKGYREMKGYLSDWLERVYYSRDTESNQAMGKLSKHLVKNLPAGAKVVEGVKLKKTGLEVLGFSTQQERPSAGGRLEVTIYLRASKKVDGDYKLQLSLWPDSPKATPPKVTSRLRVTGDGLFGTSHWRPEEIIADRFKLRVPRSWAGAEPIVLRVGVRFVPPRGSAPAVSGPKIKDTDDVSLLGEIELPAPLPTSKDSAAAR